jgi:hypothetical protein
MKRLLLLALLLGLSSPHPTWAGGVWHTLASAPAAGTDGIETMLLLSDGTVMAQGDLGAHRQSPYWYKLTPDNTGAYLNGTWTSREAMTYSRLYYSSAVLPDGRVFVAGAEYGNGTTNAEIYDPQRDSWAPVPLTPGIINPTNSLNSKGGNTGGFSDSGCIVISGGDVLVTPVNPANPGYSATYHPASSSWSTSFLYNGGNNGSGDEDEASMVKLPDGSVLVIDFGTNSSERFIPSTGQWIQDSSVTNLDGSPLILYDAYGGELGPAFLLPNGNAFFIGSAPYTAIYIPSGSTAPGRWIPGPPLPAPPGASSGLGAPDSSAAMLPNGRILCALSPTPDSSGVFKSPIYFYEYDYSAGPIGSFFPVNAPGPFNTLLGVTYNTRMLDLPDGTVLFTTGSSSNSQALNQVFIYEPTNTTPLAAGKPAIISITQNSDGSYHLTGTGLNGISAGAAYGDDAQMDSNYPLVRFTNSASGDVLYGRTYNWSSTGVMTGSTVVSTEFELPVGVLSNPGTYSLVVVVNGNPSDPVTLNVPASTWVDFTYHDLPQNGSYSYPFSTLSEGTNAVPSGGTIAIKGPFINFTGGAASSPAGTKLVTPMKLVAVGGQATIGR